MKLRGNITKEGKLVFTGSRSWVASRIKEFGGGQEIEITLEINKYKKQRSLSQNAYYWGCVVELVYEGLRDAGFDDIRDQTDAHAMLKEMFFKKVIFSPVKGELAMTLSTTQYSTGEYEERLESIRRWAFEFLGVKIPLPNTQAAMDFVQ